MTRSRRLVFLLAALLVSGSLAACGVHESKGPVRIAETEGTYLDVSDLKYQVQVSRQLNPADIQDSAYLTGIPLAKRTLSPQEVWFGVFLRVQNETGDALAPSGDIKIIDTQNEVFRPLKLGPANLYAYRADQLIPGDQTYPLLDSPGYDTPTRGALLLFKLTLTALNNRPLELIMKGRKAPQQTGIVHLDV